MSGIIALNRRRLRAQANRSMAGPVDSVRDSAKKRRVIGHRPNGTAPTTRILYIVTSLADYNSGTRQTEKGSDRLKETILPVIRDGVDSMVGAPFYFDVDVYLIAHWKVLPERLDLIRQALPEGVGLDYWSEATPSGYKLEDKEAEIIQDITRGLARQHRFVIKDKLLEYDMFVAFEDDMLIKGDHVEHYQRVSNEIERLYHATDNGTVPSRRHAERSFYGSMHKEQLMRTIPGFIRVEVLLDEENYSAQKNTGPIPVDLDFSGQQGSTNATVCCSVEEETKKNPASPTTDKIFLWETNIFSLGVRKMPDESWLDWVIMQRGPNAAVLPTESMIGDFWSGRHQEFGKERRPHPSEGNYINNQGGWMATRQQIWRWHNEICPSGFLPPFDAPDFNLDGLDLRNVEYWSGGMHIFTARHACNLQRIVLLDPESFSKHLIYHTANNKQRQLHGKREKRFVKANTLLGQANHVRNLADKKRHEDLGLEPKPARG